MTNSSFYPCAILLIFKFLFHMMAAYIVVEFADSKEVEVVPESWLNENKIPWSKSSRMYAKRNLSPRTEWPLYDVFTRYKNKKFETYEEANTMCNKLLTVSDSDTGSTHSRVKKSAQFSDYDYNSRLESDESDDGVLKNDPPKLQKSGNIRNSSSKLKTLPEDKSLTPVRVLTNFTQNIQNPMNSVFLQEVPAESGNDSSLLQESLIPLPDLTLTQCNCCCSTELDPIKIQLSQVTEEMSF